MAFPDGFLWGAATASHQVEGNDTSDWTRWEKANSSRLSSISPSVWGNLPNWSNISGQATDPANYISGKADDEYNLYPTDIGLAHSLDMNTYRFSIEWSRIEPSEGVFDDAAIQHYKDEVALLKSDQMTPFVTLWHWTLPTWLADKGGWESPDSTRFFTEYVQKVVQNLGTDVQFWVTLNEPQVYTANSYLTGIWTPQKKNPITAISVYKTLISAHQSAYTAIKAINPAAQVGIASHNIDFDAYNNTLLNQFIAGQSNYWWNEYFLNQIQNYDDYIGVNFYFRHTLNLGMEVSNGGAKNDLGWELSPEGIYPVLMNLKTYNKPIFITENGLADSQDTQRANYLKTTLEYVHQAIQDGANVRGYMHWALIDNFEWSSGFWPRFGLIAVDYSTEARTIRPSAQVYASFIKANGIQP